MGYDGSLKFDTAINEKGFNSGIKRLGSLASGGLKVLGGAVAGISAAMGAATVAGVKYNASIESYQTSFEVMTGSAEKAADVIERLKKVGAETPFELPDLADTTQLLMNYGFTADEAMDSMMMLGDISQGSADKMSRIAMAYGQMSSAGKVSLEDVKQMIEAGFNPLQEISESTGESMASLYDRISKGTLSIDEITASMQRATSEGGKYFQSMEKQSQTVNGLISTLKDNAQQLLGEVVKPITESIGQELLPAAIDALEQLTTAFQTQGVEGLIQAGGQIIANVLTGITQTLPGIVTTAAQIITSIVENLTVQIPTLLSAGTQILQAIINGMIQVLPAIGMFVLQLFTQLYTLLLEQGPVLLQKGYEILKNLIDGFVAAIPEMLPRILEFIQGIGEKLAEVAPVLIQKGFEMLSKLVEGITTALPILIAKVPEIISTFANIINDNFPTILAKGVELLWELIKGIISAIPDLIANAPKIVNAIVDVIMAFNWLSLGKNIITFFKNGISSMVGAVKNAGKSVYDAIKNAIANLPSTLANIGKTAMSGFGNAIRSMAGAAKSAAMTVGKAVLNAIKSIPNQVISIGKNIVKGLWNGISNMTGWITDKVMGFANSVLGGIKKALGIHSPSRRMRDEVGKYMALGMGIGFEKNIPVDDMQKSLDDPLKKIKGTALDVIMKPAKSVERVTYEDKISTAPLANSEQNDFDYERIGNEIKRGTKEALEGMGVYLDKKTVGKIITPEVNDNLGKIGRRKS